MESHINVLYVYVISAAEYKTLCPGGEGFRPNPITVILEGKPPSFLRFTVKLWLLFQNFKNKIKQNR